MLNQLETSNDYWDSVRQHHDEFVALARRELESDMAAHSGAVSHREMQDMPNIGEEAEVAVRVLS